MSEDAADPASDVARRVHERMLGQAGGAHDTEGVVSRRMVGDLVRQDAPLLADDLVAAATDAVLARVRGLGPLDPLLVDPSVTDVMVNGGGAVWVERHGHVAATGLVPTEATVLHLIERVVAPLGLQVDRAHPMVDGRLADGSRVHAVVRPLAVDGPCLTIRRFGARPVRLDEMAGPALEQLLVWAVRARCNLVVSGGAGAGKTTLLNALAGAIPADERVITIEDAAELRLPRPHVVRLEARPGNAEGIGEVSIRQLVRGALRMRPDRIVVGEVRAGEALDMLQAMNTGHEGSLSTCHANSPDDALRRLETMVAMGEVALPHAVVREQIESALDLVVQVARRADGGRVVVAMAEVGQLDDRGRLGTRPLTEGGRLVRLPDRPARAVGAPAPDAAWLDR